MAPAIASKIDKIDNEMLTKKNDIAPENHNLYRGNFTLKDLIFNQMIEERYILRILQKIVLLFEALYLKGLSIGEVGLEDLVVSQDYEIKIDKKALNRIKKNGQYKIEGAQWINKPPECFQNLTHYNSNKTDVFHMAVMLFNMITPGLNPFDQQADMDDKIYKYC